MDYRGRVDAGEAMRGSLLAFQVRKDGGLTQCGGSENSQKGMNAS